MLYDVVKFRVFWANYHISFSFVAPLNIQLFYVFMPTRPCIQHTLGFIIQNQINLENDATEANFEQFYWIFSSRQSFIPFSSFTRWKFTDVSVLLTRARTFISWFVFSTTDQEIPHTVFFMQIACLMESFVLKNSIFTGLSETVDVLSGRIIIHVLHIAHA